MFYDVIKMVCKNNNTSITRLCNDIGVSPGVIIKWKNGSIPKGETLLKIGERFDISIDYLLERTDNPKVNR